MIRILRPRFGTIVSAYITIALRTANTETSPQFKLTAGTSFTTSTSIIPSTPTSSEISTIHRQITNSDDYFSNTAGRPIIVEKLNITHVLPQVGDANYREDCFVVGVHFDKTPDNSTGYKLQNFLVDMNVVVTKD